MKRNYIVFLIAVLFSSVSFGQEKKIYEEGYIVKVGDKVLFTKYAPSEIKHEGEELFILTEMDILAVIT